MLVWSLLFLRIRRPPRSTPLYSSAASDGYRRQADTLLVNGKKNEATTFLRDQAQLYRQDPGVQRALARAYAEQGKIALQHLALTEYYALTGSLPAALEQLKMARSSSDASFYDQAVIDARERELQASWRELMEKSKRK